MNTTPAGNRRRLSRIVLGKSVPFTVEEIIDEFRAIQGNVIIDGRESVRSFIKGLEEYGGLIPVGRKWQVCWILKKDSSKLESFFYFEFSSSYAILICTSLFEAHF